MAKRVTVTTELTTEELHERYRRATDAVERTHWHILWLMKEGHTPEEIASMLGYTARWISIEAKLTRISAKRRNRPSRT